MSNLWFLAESVQIGQIMAYIKFTYLHYGQDDGCSWKLDLRLVYYHFHFCRDGYAALRKKLYR